MTHYTSISDFLEAHGYKAEEDIACYLKWEGRNITQLIRYKDWKDLSLDAFIQKAREKGWVEDELETPTTIGYVQTPERVQLASGQWAVVADGKIQEITPLFSDEGRGRDPTWTIDIPNGRVEIVFYDRENSLSKQLTDDFHFTCSRWFAHGEHKFIAHVVRIETIGGEEDFKKRFTLRIQNFRRYDARVGISAEELQTGDMVMIDENGQVRRAGKKD